MNTRLVIYYCVIIDYIPLFLLYTYLPCCVCLMPSPSRQEVISSRRYRSEVPVMSSLLPDKAATRPALIIGSNSPSAWTFFLSNTKSRKVFSQLINRAFFSSLPCCLKPLVPLLPLLLLEELPALCCDVRKCRNWLDDFVANCIRGAFPPELFLALCLVLAI